MSSIQKQSVVDALRVLPLGQTVVDFLDAAVFLNELESRLRAHSLDSLVVVSADQNRYVYELLSSDLQYSQIEVQLNELRIYGPVASRSG